MKFITQVTQLFHSRAGVKLNAKKVYSADGKAVRELLKVAKLLRNSVRAASVGEEEVKGGNRDGGRGGSSSRASMFDDSAGSRSLDFNLNSQPAALQDLKRARNLATEIVECGSTLHDLLGHEPELRSARDKALSFLEAVSNKLDTTSESQYVESALQGCIKEVSATCEELEDQNRQLSKDVDHIEKKIKKKTHELERVEKRLSALKQVEPPFMEEYRRAEVELQVSLVSHVCLSIYLSVCIAS